MSGPLSRRAPLSHALRATFDLPAGRLPGVTPVCPPANAIQRYLQVASSGELVQGLHQLRMVGE